MFVSWNPALLDIVGAVVVIGVLIFVHELGHFLAAKAVGIAVLRFSFGLGPRTPIGVKIGETDYCISWVPFGGFVKMAGVEDEGATEAMEGGKLEAEVPRERTFDAKPLWARIVVILAGVTMNALFAYVLFTVLAAGYGAPADRDARVAAVDTTLLPLGAAELKTLRPGDRIVRVDGDSVSSWRALVHALETAPGPHLSIEVAGRTRPILVDVPLRESASRAKLAAALAPWQAPMILRVLPGGPAAAAGLRGGDVVLAAGGAPLPSPDSLVRAIQGSPGAPLPLVVRREGRLDTIVVTPQPTQVTDSATRSARTVGRIDASIYVEVQRFGLAEALGQGLSRTADAGGLILFTLKGLVTGQVSVRELGGPVLIGQISGQVVRLGLEPFLAFVALFSINLAILNLLPIPVLDGGHLMFLLYEGLRGRPLSLTQRQRLTQIGFVVLVGIMMLALANDFVRLLK